MSVVDLTAVRKETSNNARDFTVREVLVDLIEAIDAGRLDPDKVYVAMAEVVVKEDGERVIRFPDACGGCNNHLEVIGIVAAHLAKLTANGA